MDIICTSDEGMTASVLTFSTHDVHSFIFFTFQKPAFFYHAAWRLRAGLRRQRFSFTRLLFERFLALAVLICALLAPHPQKSGVASIQSCHLPSTEKSSGLVNISITLLVVDLIILL